MDSKHIRLQNLRLLRHEAGTAAELARRLKTSNSVVSQILSLKATRDVGDEIARRSEEAFGKPYGWMDHVHADEWATVLPPPEPQTQRYSLAAARVVDKIAELDRAGRFTDGLANVLLGVLGVTPALSQSRPPIAKLEIDNDAAHHREAFRQLGEAYELDADARRSDQQLDEQEDAQKAAKKITAKARREAE